ncbi:MAG: hypothetical protein ACTJLM_03275 [Ehrlichia sp.]
MQSSVKYTELERTLSGYYKLCETQKLSLNTRRRYTLKISLYVIHLVNVASFAMLAANFSFVTKLVNGSESLFGKSAASIYFSVALVVFVISLMLLMALFYLSSVKDKDTKFANRYAKFTECTWNVVSLLKEDLAGLLRRCCELGEECKALKSEYDKFSLDVKNRLAVLEDCHANHVKNVGVCVNALKSSSEELASRMRLLINKNEALSKDLTEFLDNIEGIIREEGVCFGMKISALGKLQDQFSQGISVIDLVILARKVIQEINEVGLASKGSFFSKPSLGCEIQSLACKLKECVNLDVEKVDGYRHAKRMKDCIGCFMLSYNPEKSYREYSGKCKEEAVKANVDYALHLVFFLDLALSRFLVGESVKCLTESCQSAARFVRYGFSVLGSDLAQQGDVSGETSNSSIVRLDGASASSGLSVSRGV